MPLKTRSFLNYGTPCIRAVRNESKLYDGESNSQTIALSGLVDDDVARSAQVAGDDLLEKTVCA